jgi:hypothetical protein
MKHLGCLKKLELLDLSYTKIGDPTLHALSSMSTLRDLTVTGTAVTDRGLAYLKGMKSLESLEARVTEIGDPGLEALRTLPKLRQVCVDSTNITDAACEAFRKARPGVKVWNR